jgi:hypothetical protein
MEYRLITPYNNEGPVGGRLFDKMILISKNDIIKDLINVLEQEIDSEIKEYAGVDLYLYDLRFFIQSDKNNKIRLVWGVQNEIIEDNKSGNRYLRVCRRVSREIDLDESWPITHS